MSDLPAQTGAPVTLTQQVARGVAWTALERWVVRVLNLGTFVVLARQLRPDELGLVALAMTFVAIVTVVAEAGLGAYIVQVGRPNSRMINSTFWTAVGLSSVGAALLAASGPLWADLFNESGLAPVLAALATTLVFTGLSTVHVALLQRSLRFKPLAVRQTIAALVASIVAVTLAFAGAGAWALVAQSVTMAAVGTLVLWWSSSWRPALRFSREDANASLAFGAKVMGASVLKAARDQGEPLLIGVLLGAPSLGFWSVATRIYTIVIELGVSVVSVVATPAFALVHRDTARLQRAYRRATSVSATVVIPLLVVLSAVSDDLIPLVFGEQWRRSGELASILTIMALFAVLVNFDGPVYLAIGRPGVELALTAFIVAFHLATVAAVAHWGLTPLAIALLARATLSWPVRVVALKRVAGIDWRAYAGTAVCFFCAGLAAVVMAITEQFWLTGHGALSVAGTSLAGTVIYLVAMSFSKDFRDLAKQLLASASRRRNAASTPRPFADAKASGDACAGNQTGPRDAVNQ